MNDASASDRDGYLAPGDLSDEFDLFRSEMRSLFRRHKWWVTGIMLSSISLSTAINTWVVLSTR